MTATATAAEKATSAKLNNPTIDMVRVPREAIKKLGGADWAEALCHGSEGVGGCALDRVALGDTTQQQDRPNWVVPRNQQGVEQVYLPLGHAWLREVRGRAFLYLQNW